MAPQTEPIIARTIDANTAEVDIPGIGTVVVMRALDTDTGEQTAKILWDGDVAQTPTVEPA